MQMLYNSDSFVGVAFEVPVGEGQAQAPRGGYEIVDKFARKEIYIQGAVAERFQKGVEALVAEGPNPEALDEFIGSFAVDVVAALLMDRLWLESKVSHHRNSYFCEAFNKF